MNYRTFLLLIAYTAIVLLGRGATVLFAQTKDSTAEKPKSKIRLTPLPVVMYAPETRLGLGALAILNFNLGKDSATRTSYLQSSFIFTINKQIDFDNEVVMFTNKERFFIKARVRYLHMPEFYYGIGNELPESNQQLVTYNQFFAEARVLRKIRKNLFAGGYFKSNNINNPTPSDTGIWQRQHYLGQDGYHVSGIGVDIITDSRDLIYNASKGFYTEFYALVYGKYTGSNYAMTELLVDMRKYFTILRAKRHVLAFHLLCASSSGNVPYKDLSEFGGAYMMRGYYRGRYRDKKQLSFQMEYRMPVWKFIGVCAWVGAGRVAPTVKELDVEGLHPNYGLGLRLKINKKDNINIRVDYGIGAKSTGIYINILEAF